MGKASYIVPEQKCTLSVYDYLGWVVVFECKKPPISSVCLLV